MMQKRMLWTMPLVVLLGACQNVDKPVMVGLANPASVYCQQAGGQSIAKKDGAGNEYAMCRLPNGQELEEWDYFRQNQQKNRCVAEKASRLIGQKDMDDQLIKKATHANTIRRVESNMGVTADYQESRITITIDPKKKMILHAVCG